MRLVASKFKRHDTGASLAQMPTYLFGSTCLHFEVCSYLLPDNPNVHASINDTA